VFRTALVGARINGEIIPVICVELEQEHKRFNKADLIQELMVIGSSHPETRNIKHILFHSGFPVDIRHNAKIGRESLSKWATEELR
jgi:hypothetical protein